MNWFGRDSNSVHDHQTPPTDHQLKMSLLDDFVLNGSMASTMATTTATATATTTNKCHRRYESLSPGIDHCPAASNTTTATSIATRTTNLRRNRETWVKTTTSCCSRTRKVLEASMASRLLLVLFCLLCPVSVVANPSAEPTLLQQQQQQSQGGPLPFPEGNLTIFCSYSATLSKFSALDILILLALSLRLSPKEYGDGV